MRELSLHILDIVQNSVAAGASLITIAVEEALSRSLFAFTIEDNGKGMDAGLLARVSDPFTTSRTTRKVGLGIPLLKLACEQTGGTLVITSEVNVGTVVKATLGYHSIDRQPMGDMAGTMAVLVAGSPEIDFVYRHTTEGGTFALDTREVREQLGDVPLSQPEVLAWIRDYILDGIKSIGGE